MTSEARVLYTVQELNQTTWNTKEGREFNNAGIELKHRGKFIFTFIYRHIKQAFKDLKNKWPHTGNKNVLKFNVPIYYICVFLKSGPVAYSDSRIFEIMNISRPSAGQADERPIHKNVCTITKQYRTLWIYNNALNSWS
jgi:hypothetical protein